jgi:hypothetical protein
MVKLSSLAIAITRSVCGKSQLLPAKQH